MFNVQRILDEYNKAKDNKDYELADTYRHLLFEKDVTFGLANGESETYPIFETKKFRLYTLAKNIKESKRAIYPFDRDKKGFPMKWKDSYKEVLDLINKLQQTDWR